MRVCIHQGANDIGGNCVEIEHAGARLILDIGLPLDVGMDGDVQFPPVLGLREGDRSIVGLIISHGHPDHYGLIAEVHDSIPRYLGEATQRILRESEFFTGMGADIEAAEFLVDRIPLKIGPFTVTPYLADHSAFDAYSLLVDAGDRRLFYSGDLRAHGRKSALFDRLSADPPKDVDVLLLEGTNVEAAPSTDGLSERAVEDRCVELFRSTEGMALVCYSAQNIDRLVTLFRAAKRASRMFVMGLYGATIARATRRPTIPQAEWDEVGVYVPQTQRLKVKRSAEFERTARIRKHRLFPEALADHSGDLVMTFRATMRNELDRAGCLKGACAVWSLWPGYLECRSGAELRRWLEAHNIPLDYIHSSGHASQRDLQRFAGAINAREVVPLHTRNPDRYAELFANVQLRQDKEWWVV